MKSSRESARAAQDYRLLMAKNVRPERIAATFAPLDIGNHDRAKALTEWKTAWSLTPPRYRSSIRPPVALAPILKAYAKLPEMRAHHERMKTLARTDSAPAVNIPRTVAIDMPAPATARIDAMRQAAEETHTMTAALIAHAHSHVERELDARMGSGHEWHGHTIRGVLTSPEGSELARLTAFRLARSQLRGAGFEVEEGHGPHVEFALPVTRSSHHPAVRAFFATVDNP